MKPARGFTLIEIMVVMVIIGIMALMIGLSVGNRSSEDRMEAEARRIQQLLQFASDEAQAKGLEIGLRYDQQAYQFLELSDDGKWQVVRQGSLRPRRISAPMYLEMRVEQELVTPAAEVGLEPAFAASEDDEDDAAKEDDEAAEGLEPQMLLLSSGEMTPFSLDVKLPDYEVYYRVSGDVLGRLTFSRQVDAS